MKFPVSAMAGDGLIIQAARAISALLLILVQFILGNIQTDTCITIYQHQDDPGDSVWMTKR